MKVCAEVSTHPTDPNIWGLKNCTGEKWVATMSDGGVKDIEPGRSVRLADKTKVNFGKVEVRDSLLTKTSKEPYWRTIMARGTL